MPKKSVEDIWKQLNASSNLANRRSSPVRDKLGLATKLGLPAASSGQQPAAIQQHDVPVHSDGSPAAGMAPEHIKASPRAELAPLEAVQSETAASPSCRPAYSATYSASQTLTGL